MELVHTMHPTDFYSANPMKNITLSADEKLIKAAREIAKHKQTTLNAEFQRWIENYVSRRNRVNNYLKLMDELAYVSTDGRSFSRDEMNEG